MKRIFIAIGLVLILGGCAPAVVRKYSGAQLEVTDVAILLQSKDKRIQVFEVDGEYVLNRISTYNPDDWREVHLLPGVHKLKGGVYVGNKYAIFQEDYVFQAGKKYEPRFKMVDSGEKVIVELPEVK